MVNYYTFSLIGLGFGYLLRLLAEKYSGEILSSMNKKMSDCCDNLTF